MLEILTWAAIVIVPVWIILIVAFALSLVREYRR